MLGWKTGSMTVCKRCTTQVQVSTKRDTPCEVGAFNIPPNVALVGSSIHKPAQHGKVSFSGAQWSYTPQKGFVGSDTFTTERDYVSDAKAFVTFNEVHMEVTP
jgi:hypothetical protein